MTRSEFLGTSALYIASFFWGTAYIAQKILVDAGIPPFYMVGLRMAFALIMIPMILRKPLSSKTLRRGFTMGIFLYLVFSLQTYGLKTIDSSVSSFVSSLNLVLIPLLNTFFFKQKLKTSNAISIFIALIGVYCFNLTSNSMFVWNWGLFLTVLCSIAIALELVYASYFMYEEDPLQLAGLQNLVCGTLAFISAFTFEGAFPTQWDKSSLLAITYLGVIASVGCYILLLTGQKLVRNSLKVGLIMALQPLFTTVVALLILNEQLSFFKIIGMLCMIVAILIDEYILFKEKNKTKQIVA